MYRMEKLHKEVMEKILFPLEEKWINLEDFGQYLVLKHHEERSIFTWVDEEWKTIEEAKEQLKEIEERLWKDFLEKIWLEYYKFMDRKNVYLYNNWMITKEQLDEMETKFNYYVPYQRVMEENWDLTNAWRLWKWYNIKGSEFKKANGSQREIYNPIKSLYSEYFNSFNRTEKNHVMRSLANLTRTVTREWITIEWVNEKAIKKGWDKGFIKKQKGIPAFTEDWDFNFLHKIAPWKNEIFFKENWESFLLTVPDELWKTFNAMNSQSELETLWMIHRWLWQLYTTFNLAFWPVNNIRDLWEAMAWISKEFTEKDWAMVLKNLPKAYKEIVKHWKYYEEWLSVWWKTAVMEWVDLKHMWKKLQDEIDAEFGVWFQWKLPVKIIKKLIKWIENYNDFFENSIRISVYITFRKQWKTAEEAAIISKDSTLDFNEKGANSWSIRNLFLFLNPAMKGWIKAFDYFTSKRWLWHIWALWIAFTMLSLLKWLIDGDDYDKLPFEQKMSNLHIPWTTIKIPLTYWFRYLNAIAIKIADARRWKTLDWSDSLDVVKGLEQTFLPTDGEISIIAPLKHIAINTAWHWGQIVYRKPYSHLKDYQQYNESTSEFSKYLTRTLYKKTGADIAPWNVDYFINSYLGGVMTPFIQFYDAIDNWDIRKAPVVRKIIWDNEKYTKYAIYNILQKDTIPPEDVDLFYALVDKLDDPEDYRKKISQRQFTIKRQKLFEDRYAWQDDEYIINDLRKFYEAWYIWRTDLGNIVADSIQDIHNDRDKMYELFPKRSNTKKHYLDFAQNNPKVIEEIYKFEQQTLKNIDVNSRKSYELLKDTINYRYNTVNQKSFYIINKTAYKTFIENNFGNLIKVNP